MSQRIFWDRRSGYDRRMYNSHPEVDYRSSDRRKTVRNDYVLMVGNTGVDLFSLLVLTPVLVLCVMGVLGPVMAF